MLPALGAGSVTTDGIRAKVPRP